MGWREKRERKRRERERGEKIKEQNRRGETN